MDDPTVSMPQRLEPLVSVSSILYQKWKIEEPSWMVDKSYTPTLAMVPGS